MTALLSNKVRRLSRTCNCLIFSQCIYLFWMFVALLNNGSNTPALMYALVFVFLVVFFSKFKKSLALLANEGDDDQEMVSRIFMFVAFVLFGVQLISSVYLVMGKGYSYLTGFTADMRAGVVAPKAIGRLLLYLVLPAYTLLFGTQFFVRLFRLNKTQQASYETLQITA